MTDAAGEPPASGRKRIETGIERMRAPLDPPVPAWCRVLRGFAIALTLGAALWIADHLR